MKHHVKRCQVIATPGKNPTKNTKLIDRCKHDHPKQWLIPHAHRFDITAWAWHAKQDAQQTRTAKVLRHMHQPEPRELQSYLCSDISFAFIPAISGTFNFLSKVLFTFPSWYLFAIGLNPIFSFGWIVPPILRSTAKERDSQEQALHERLHMTHRSFTFSAAFYQKPYMHTSIGIANVSCNSRLAVQIVSLSYSLFIRHYWRNPFQFVVLCLLICLNSAGLLISHHVCLETNEVAPGKGKMHMQELCKSIHNAKKVIACQPKSTALACLQHRVPLHALLSNDEGDLLSGETQKRSPHSTSNWFAEFCKSLCLSQFTASFINDWAKESIAEHARRFKMQKYKKWKMKKTAADHTRKNMSSLWIAALLLASSPQGWATHNRHPEFTSKSFMQMILPQVHLRKPCYDFSFL